MDPWWAMVADWFRPEHYWQLSPLVMAVALALLSLVFEDVALLIGVAILHHEAGHLLPVVLGLYFGITGGDMLLYTAGRWLQHLPFIARRLTRPATQSRVARMRTQLLPMLVICRVIPASRLPTFLAAGLVRVPFARYAAISLLTVGVWVALVTFGGFNLARAVESMLGISSAWLLLPVALLMAGATLYHAKGRRYAV